MLSMQKTAPLFSLVVVMGLSQDTCFLSQAVKNYYNDCFLVS